PDGTLRRAPKRHNPPGHTVSGRRLSLPYRKRGGRPTRGWDGRLREATRSLRGARGPRLWNALLDGDRRAGLLQGLLGLVRGLLVDLLQQRLRRAVHQVLGLLEAEARQRADLLDDLDLLVACGLQDDVELILRGGLLGRGGGTARTRGGGHGRDRRGGLDVEDLLELLHELRELEKGHLLERVEQLVGAELRHDLSSAYGLNWGLRNRGCVLGGRLGGLGGRLCGLAALLALGAQRLGELGRLRRQGVEERRRVGQRPLHRTGELREEDLARLEVGEL